MLYLAVFGFGIGVGMVLAAVLLKWAILLINKEGHEESGPPDDDPYRDYKMSGTA